MALTQNQKNEFNEQINKKMENNISHKQNLIPIYIKLHWVEKDKSPTLKLIKNYGGPKYVVTYINQKHKYRYLENFGFQILTIIDAKDPHVSKNRNFIIDHAHQNNYKYVIDLDDDITSVAYGTYGETVKTKSPMIKLKAIDFETLVISWMNEVEKFPQKLNNKWGISGIFNGNRFANLTDRDLNELVPLGRAIQIFMYNVPELKTHHIKYETTNIWEDYDIILQCAKNKLQIPMVKYLYYKSHSMNVDTKQVSGNYVFNKNIKFSIGLLTKWSDRYVKLSQSMNKKQYPNCLLKWHNIKRDFGSFTQPLFPIEYDWMEYVNQGLYTQLQMIDFIKGNYEG